VRRASFSLVAKVCRDFQYCGGGRSLILYGDSMA
jgi:hypothetical protein